LDSHNRINGDVTAGSGRINRLRVADDLIFLASTEQRLEYALDRSPAARYQAAQAEKKASPGST